MTTQAQALPQLGGRLFLTDGGMETTLIFHEGLDLPHFAAFVLLRTEAGRAMTRRYYERYLAIARDAGAGFILESPTWRASADWGARLGYTKAGITAVNREAIELMREIAWEAVGVRPIVVSGNIGPRGDGYLASEVMTPDEAEAYHSLQARAFADAGADFISAFTMTNTSEAIGIVRAAEAVGLPVVISFTLETDGLLPTGQSLAAAIAEVDAATVSRPAYYMINCAHPTHFAPTLGELGSIGSRIRGIRANASRRSHQELNEAPDLDAGNPHELGAEYRELLARFPHINVLGGCCGTDHRHVAAIATSCGHGLAMVGRS